MSDDPNILQDFPAVVDYYFKDTGDIIGFLFLSYLTSFFVAPVIQK